MAAASQQQTLILVSTNGIDWEPRNSFSYGQYRSVTFANGRFIVSGANVFKSGSNGALVSENGYSWNFACGTPTGPIAFGNDLFVEGGPHGFTVLVHTAKRNAVLACYNFSGAPIQSKAYATAMGCSWHRCPAGNGFVAEIRRTSICFKQQSGDHPIYRGSSMTLRLGAALSRDNVTLDEIGSDPLGDVASHMEEWSAQNRARLSVEIV